MHPRDWSGRLTIRAALLLGFGLTLGIWLVAGYYFTQQRNDTESEAVRINAQYLETQQLLSAVRTQVLLGSIYVRDAILDPNPQMVDYYRQEVEGANTALNDVLRTYVVVMTSSPEPERVVRLQEEVGRFRHMLLRVLNIDRTNWSAQALVLLNTEVGPRREAVIRVSEEVRALDESNFMKRQLEIGEVYATNQRRLWWSLGLALATSSAVVLIVALYAGRLETRLQRQRVRDAETALELQHLSAKLITAQEEERRTIARELHDEVGQVLTAIKVELAVAQHRIETAGGSADALADARSITDGALVAVRDISHLLHPALLDDLGLEAAVKWYIDGFSRRHDIRVDILHHDLGGRFAPEIETSIYRIIQEALTNVAKHARASGCGVCIEQFTETVRVTIEDDGIGFDTAHVSHARADSGLGLIGIRERATHLRGTVRIETAPGRGTRLTVELPVRPGVTGEDESIGDALPAPVMPVTQNG